MCIRDRGNIWSRASGFINKYIGLIGTVIAAITGVSMKLNQLREQRNKREEAKADVEALTGPVSYTHLIEEVNKANEETTNNKITTPIIDEEKAKALLKKKLEEEAKLLSLIHILAEYLRNNSNELATVRFSAFCGAMLSNNSFNCKYNMFFQKRKTSSVFFGMGW